MISALINIYLYLANANLAIVVRNPNPELSFANNCDLAESGLILFLDLDSFDQKSI